MAGVAAGIAGAEVTFTDIDEQALSLAAASMTLNGVPAEKVRVASVDLLEAARDWGAVESTFSNSLGFDLIVASEASSAMIEILP